MTIFYKPAKALKLPSEFKQSSMDVVIRAYFAALPKLPKTLLTTNREHCVAVHDHLTDYVYFKKVGSGAMSYIMGRVGPFETVVYRHAA